MSNTNSFKNRPSWTLLYRLPDLLREREYIHGATCYEFFFDENTAQIRYDELFELGFAIVTKRFYYAGYYGNNHDYLHLVIDNNIISFMLVD